MIFLIFLKKCSTEYFRFLLVRQSTIVKLLKYRSTLLFLLTVYTGGSVVRRGYSWCLVRYYDIKKNYSLLLCVVLLLSVLLLYIYFLKLLYHIAYNTISLLCVKKTHRVLKNRVNNQSTVYHIMHIHREKYCDIQQYTLCIKIFLITLRQ